MEAGGSQVVLPDGAEPPFEVFVNGVLQQDGRDYRVEGRRILFARRLVQPRRTSAGMLARLLVAGRYKPEHTVDVVYTRTGRREMAHGLAIDAAATSRPG